MEADWEFEIGTGAPVIEAHWSGFADLRADPEHAWHLPETVRFPALAATLIRLNSRDSPVWTSKCDFFPQLSAEEFEAGELDADASHASHAAACYIDLHPRHDRQWSTPDLAALVCKTLCARLHSIPLRHCRVDLVIRRALIASNINDLGVTAYITACGATAPDATSALQHALSAFVDAILLPHRVEEDVTKLQ